MTVGANVKQCLATIKGIEASLSTLAINTSSEQDQQILHEEMMNIGQVKEDLMARVRQLEQQEDQYKGF
ncbi:DUF1657 domain-containing protein [Bacillaceae bacterium S4-13-56]